MSNQIKLTIDLSDELVDKILTIMAITSQKERSTRGYANAYGGNGGATPPPPKGEDKPPMGFNMGDKK